jgi:hypothetical protein
MSGEQAAFSSVLVESDDWRVRESCRSPEARLPDGVQPH